jgi:hypothetical protein
LKPSKIRQKSNKFTCTRRHVHRRVAQVFIRSKVSKALRQRPLETRPSTKASKISTGRAWDTLGQRTSWENEGKIMEKLEIS